MEKLYTFLNFFVFCLLVLGIDKGFCEKVKLKIILFFEICIYILSGKIF